MKYQKSIILLFINRYFLFCVCLYSSFTVSSQPSDSHKKHATETIPSNLTTPTIDLSIFYDEMDGFNLVISTEHYRFLPPQRASKEDITILEGHAHIFINDVKILRTYGKDIHLPEHLFRKGFNKLMVSLNTHQHATWTSATGQDVMATILVDTNASSLLKSH